MTSPVIESNSPFNCLSIGAANSPDIRPLYLDSQGRNIGLERLTLWQAAVKVSMLFVLFIANIASFGLIGYRNPDLYLQLKAICQGPYTAVLMSKQDQNKKLPIQNFNAANNAIADLEIAVQRIDADVERLFDDTTQQSLSESVNKLQHELAAVQQGLRDERAERDLQARLAVYITSFVMGLFNLYLLYDRYRANSWTVTEIDSLWARLNQQNGVRG